MVEAIPDVMTPSTQSAMWRATRRIRSGDRIRIDGERAVVEPI